MTADAAEQFRDAAARYCACVERAGGIPAAALLREVEAHLARLHALALGLPVVAEPPGGAARPAADGPAHGRCVAGLRAALGAEARYWETGDPVAAAGAEGPGPAAVVAGDLAEDLSDTYLLLKGGLAAWRDGDAAARAAAVWEWRFTFTMHWGASLVGALRAIHWRRHVHGAVDLGLRPEAERGAAADRPPGA